MEKINSRIKNLVPIKNRSKNEARKISQKGGIASGKVRREKKTFQTVAKQLLDMKLTLPKMKQRLKEMFPHLDNDAITNRTATLFILIQKAFQGNVKAIEILRDTAGEKAINEADNEEQNLKNIKEIIVNIR
jgi:hypothetical protein